MNTSQALAAILIAGLCTYAMRALPSLIFGGKKQMPPLLSYLGQVLTPAIMAALLVYCLRNSAVGGLTSLLPQLISVAVTALLHLWQRNALVSIITGTAAYMLLLHFVF